MMKTCTKCGVLKPLSGYSKKRHVKSGYRANCKECDAAYVNANRERISAAGIEYRKAHPEVMRRNVAKYVERNEELVKARRKAWRQRNLDHVNALQSAYSLAHRAENRAKTARYRTRKTTAGGSFTAADMEKQYAVQAGLCYYCDEPLNGKSEAEHRIPISRGGTSWPENMVCACGPCNRKKHNRTDAEYFAMRKTA